MEGRRCRKGGEPGEDPLIALPCGLLYGLFVLRKSGFVAPARVRVRLSDRSARQPGIRRKVVVRFLAGTAGGMLAGVTYALTAQLVSAISPDMSVEDDQGLLIQETVFSAAVYGLAFGPACGLLLALVVVLETPANLTTATSPADLLTVNRSTALRLAVLSGGVSARGRRWWGWVGIRR
ncbi:hypothetical protein [Amycolatopsis sp. YIM 10]|uniref:hypothetical protein n=1 Tax=Amycolatopsis sp. YIM 10 TaxID=2653857 RepID=UPI00128FF3DE|nr:hypothetical protein [Amycolatopsis sp. YIM 10]